MKTILLLIAILLSLNFHALHAQISDDFSDGDFTQAPAWTGDTESFTISSNYELQLNASTGGEAHLSLPHNQISTDTLEWRFKIRLSFSPSGNNFARIYLSSDSLNLKSATLKGYYLQFGENLSNDAIELFYQENGISQSVCRGADGFIANAFSCTILVQKYVTGAWKIFVRESGTGSYQLHAEGQMNLSPPNSAIGVYCRFTASNSTKFFFDDFYFGSPILDTTKPEIISVNPCSDFRKIELLFSEHVDPASALSPQNYRIDENGQFPTDCTFSDEDHRKIVLTFATPFTERVYYQLTVSNIEDISGNILRECSFPVLFFKIKRNEILISEIMANPTPPVQLPDCEYIELKSNLPFPVTLAGWKLKVGNSVKILPEIQLASHDFAVIVTTGCRTEFSSFSNIVAVSSLSIANSGQQLTLYNDAGETIHHVCFKQNWHQNHLKRNGGWSLEIIDPENPCGESENWDSSVSELGGTPGFANSIHRENKDTETPGMSKLTILDSVTVRLYFTESISIDTVTVSELFSIDRNLNIIHLEEIPPDFKSLRIKVSAPLQVNTIYTLTLTGTICDCAGLSVPQGKFLFFGMPQKAGPGDIVINEVLSNPFGSDDADFIEIYNRSDKIIDLKNIQIGSGKGDIPDKTILAVSDGYNLFPKSYIALCKNKKLTQQHYVCPHPENLLECDSLPNFPNESGGVHILDHHHNPIDKLIYEPSMHYRMLTSSDGVSLERIHFETETQDHNNWKSAAASVGFATPGYKNSQYSDPVETGDILQVIPEIFSPDNDGFDDFVEFYCHFPDGENRVSLSIFDRQGNLVKILTNNQLCGTEEHFLWDGISEKGTTVLPGLYIIKMQYWNENGKVKNSKKTVGVAFRNR